MEFLKANLSMKSACYSLNMNLDWNNDVFICYRYIWALKLFTLNTYLVSVKRYAFLELLIKGLNNDKNDKRHNFINRAHLKQS